MSKEKLAELVTVKWEDDCNTGWPVKQCTMSLSFNVKYQVDSNIYEMNEPEIKRYIQNEILKRLDRDVKSVLYPDIEEVIDELHCIARLLEETHMRELGILSKDELFYKGEPFYHVLERLADKLS